MIIVGTADQHVDATMVGGWNAAAGVHSNWIESFAQLQNVVDLCNERKADLLIVAGDVFHNGRPSAEAVHRYIKTLNGLKRTKVIFTDGNHDQTSVLGSHKTPIGAYLAEQKWTHAAASQTEVIEFNGVSIAAIPWHRVAGENSLEKTAKVLEDDLNRLKDIVSDYDRPSLLFGHFTVDEASFNSGRRSSELLMSTSALEATLSTDHLEEGPWSFWRAGHIHKQQYLGKKGGYFGSTYKVSFGEQNEKKGAEVIELNEDGTYTHEFVEFKVRELKSIQLVDGVDLLPAVADTLIERDILRLILEADAEYTQRTQLLIEDLVKRGVEVQHRRLPKERKQVKSVSVSIETDPRSAMETYAKLNLDDPDRIEKSCKLFSTLMQEVENN